MNLLNFLNYVQRLPLKQMYNQKLSPALSLIERKYIISFEDYLLNNKGYEYHSIPSTVSIDTYERQGTVKAKNISLVKFGKENIALAGSAEQGFLEKFQGENVKSQKMFATNQCFRQEDSYEKNFRLFEFKKIEQFSFEKSKYEALLTLFEFMENTQKFLSSNYIEHRVIDQTEDEGYHEIKMDIEIETKTFGWIEVGSYTYFGEEQSKRFNITGATHTVSGTGLAFPRVLIPIIENHKDSQLILG